MGAILTAAVTMQPFFASDPPPWAGKRQVGEEVMTVAQMLDTKLNATQASVVKGQMLGMWARLCDAEHARNMALARSYEIQLSDLQQDYMMLTGLSYPFRQCL